MSRTLRKAVESTKQRRETELRLPDEGIANLEDVPELCELHIIWGANSRHPAPWKAIPEAIKGQLFEMRAACDIDYPQLARGSHFHVACRCLWSRSKWHQTINIFYSWSRDQGDFRWPKLTDTIRRGYHFVPQTAVNQAWKSPDRSVTFANLESWSQMLQPMI